MKLSELVAYRKLFKDHIPLDLERKLQDYIGPLQHIFSSDHSINFPDLETALEQSRKNLSGELQRFYETVSQIETRINESIRSVESQYFGRSYRLYDDQLNEHNRFDINILDRRLDLSSEAMEYIESRVKLYTNWQFPGIILRPAKEDWIAHLVALDPLYIVDFYPEYLDFAMSRFSPEYQRRLRPYVINETSEEKLLAGLPQNQIGYCLIYNFLHYRPFEIARRYLTEIFALLRPGGVLAFSFNDCDQSSGVDQVERGLMCYTPGGLMRALAESLGYTVIHLYKASASTTWLELQKPGKASSLRGGQALAQIIDKSARNVDSTETNQYTSKQVRQIQKQAAQLGISDAHLLEPKTLQEMILQRKKLT